MLSEDVLLSIIIVNYNVKEFLQNLLRSIEKSSDNVPMEIIVVDNASDDGSVELLREKFPYVHLIANKENLGFGAANNLALSIAKGRYLLLLNPDTIVQENTFSTLISFFENTPEAGMAGCKVLNSDGTLQLACRRGFPGPWTSFCKVSGLSKLFPQSRLFARYNLTYLDENKTYEVDAISGAFMFMRREVYEKIGGFDQQFFMYGEDLDLCYRTQKAGFKVFYVHSTQIIHYKGESTKRSSIDETKVFYDAMHLFVKKHFSSSFLVEFILRFAIVLRKLLAFLNIYKLPVMSMILDFIFVDIAILLADKLYSFYGWHGFPPFSIKIVYIIPAMLQVLISAMTGVYRRDRLSVFRTLSALIFGFFALSSATFFFKQYAYSRAVVILIYILNFILLPLWRIAAKFITGMSDGRDSYRTKTIIVGTGDYSVQLARKLKSRFTSIHHIAGFISLTRKDTGRRIDGFEVIGSLDNIQKIIHEQKINEVIFSSGEVSYQQMLGVVAICQRENVDFKVAGNELGFLVGKSSITMLDDIPLLEVYYNISSISSRITKRTVDILISVILLASVYPFVYVFADKQKKTLLSSLMLQLPSVIRGRKSLVGPKCVRGDLNLYLGKPGLTGLWLTDAETDKTEDEEILKLDVFYAKNQNIWMDLEILGKTMNLMSGPGDKTNKNVRRNYE
ncbi:MAG: glycosyltransferase [Bacteroidota bacterium]